MKKLVSQPISQICTLFIVLSVCSCHPSREQLEGLFTLDDQQFESVYTPNDPLVFEAGNPSNTAIDSVVYSLDGQVLGRSKQISKMTFPLAKATTGYHFLKALFYMENDTISKSVRLEIGSPIEPEILHFTLVKKYPHDPKAFTEGYEFYNGELWESTGQKGSSYIAKVNVNTGASETKIPLEANYFGEGITLINDKIYQLTWQDNMGFIYDAKTGKRLKSFSFDKAVEGWGMTNDGKQLYHSDGTEKIWTMDPETQKLTQSVHVYAGKQKIKSINELEWVDGKIYGNIWQKDAIALINPKTGYVEGVLDLSTLRAQVKNSEAEVLNGIAYRKETNTFFVTGKNWDSTFEIKIN
ncbi:MAG: glutamine cyclotransferase [Flavobacterium sp. BFFFF2]|nr:MAG: glutamine cyclotransferase [Flavobacterium sp. BFFFF2]